MPKPSLLITIAIALLTALIWYVLSDAEDEPPWPQKIQGFAFSPVRQHEDPTRNLYPTREEINEDLRLLKDKTYAVRTYSVKSSFADIPELAEAQGFNVALGAWISGDTKADMEEMEHILANNPVLMDNLSREAKIILFGKA